MGVTGLWRLIEPAGKPVPVETLENKVLAVDISIWLHQMVKGYQDAKGAPLPNAHLMGLFQRVCKLLYFRIKPVFVFDGGFPQLKKETIAKRQDQKSKYNSESERLKRELAFLLNKKTAIGSLLGKEISPKKNNNDEQNVDDIFKLPALPQKDEESESESEDEQNSSGSIIDVHSVDIQSQSFKNLPLKEKYDLLIELKETRKMNSWGKLHELPKKSDNFSDFQLQRLLKRRKVQECLEETEKEMGDCGMSLNDLESLLNEEGIDTKIESLPTKRIAANDSTRYVLINNVKQALADAKKKRDDESKASTSKVENVNNNNPELYKKVELDEDLEKAIKMSLECENEPNTSAFTSKTEDSWTSYLTESDYSDTEDDLEQPDMSSAKAYIMQYSDFTNRAIDDIVTRNKVRDKHKNKISKVDQVLDEINNEKLIITERLNLLSDDDEVRVSDSCENVTQDLHVITSKTSLENNKVFDNQNDINATQASVVFIENPDESIIDLDTSIEDKEISTKEENKTVNVESDSGDEDFEEVPDIKIPTCTSKKTVVQLTLDSYRVADDDDIFADVFENRNDVDTVKKNDTKIELIEKKIDCDDCVTSNNEHIDFKKDCSKKNVLPLNIEVLNDDKTSQEKETTESSLDHSEQEEKESQATKKITSDINDMSIITESEKSPEIINNTIHKPLSMEVLNTMAEEIQIEEQELLQEKGKLDRIGRNITEQMTKEAQELLRIFGIPYVVAPMEAEAQCAFLESVKLTDGTITDDSDIWLFGGKTVYKNFFNQKKYVLQFLAERIERSFNLSREQLILLALLVGSDYTTGVAGVGPVTALEILASFPINKKELGKEMTKSTTQYSHVVNGLQEFKKWVRAGKKTDNTSLKKKLKNISLGEDFPSVRVVKAYLEPKVEKSEDTFSWGELDITILRDYTKTKFGWSQHKLDEIIKPVIKRLMERKNQKTLEDFFKRKVEFQSLEDQMSKRVKAAVQRMGPNLEITEDQGETTKETKPGDKRKADKSEGKFKVPKKPSKAKISKKDEASVLKDQGVNIVSEIIASKSDNDIRIPKTDRVQEIIPQREKDKQSLLQNKLKAIEVFRKTNIDRKKKVVKRKALKPKEKADLSESDSD